MDFIQRLTYNGSEICIVENQFSTDELLSKLERKELYEEELKKLKTPFRKQEYLAVRLALKILLGGEEKKINYNEDGKPILEDGSYKISFSHCKNYVAVMIHPSLEVGVDIEKPSDKLIKVHQKYLGNAELAYYAETQDFSYLRVVWSAKEALFKIIGMKAYNFAEQLYIPAFGDSKKGKVEAIHTLTGKKYCVHFILEKDYTLAYSLYNEEL